MTKKSAHRLRGVITGGLAGLLAAGVALGVAQLAAGLTGPQGSPVVAVGGVAINLTPVPVKDFVIAHVGTHDKQVLVAGILLILAAFAALIGVLARRREAYGVAGLAVFAGLGVAAAITRPDAAVADAPAGHRRGRRRRLRSPCPGPRGSGRPGRGRAPQPTGRRFPPASVRGPGRGRS